MDIALRIIDIAFPIFSIVLVGFFCGKKFDPDMSVANFLNMEVFIPALIFSVLVGQSIDVRDYLPLIAAATAVVIGSGILVWPIARLLNIHIKTLAPPIMFNNSGNMGLPLMVLTFGEAGLAIAMVLFIVENTLHFTIGSAWLNNRNGNPFSALYSPIIFASLLGILLGMGGLTVPGFILEPIEMLGDIVIPLMLFSLGVRLSTSSLNDIKIGVIGGIACPLSGLLMVVLILPLVDLTAIETGALFLFGALPPAILNFMFAERYDQEPDKVASIVIIGNGLTLITLPLVLLYVLPRFS